MRRAIGVAQDLENAVEGARVTPAAKWRCSSATGSRLDLLEDARRLAVLRNAGLISLRRADRGTASGSRGGGEGAGALGRVGRRGFTGTVVESLSRIFCSGDACVAFDAQRRRSFGKRSGCAGTRRRRRHSRNATQASPLEGTRRRRRLYRCSVCCIFNNRKERSRAHSPDRFPQASPHRGDGRGPLQCPPKPLPHLRPPNRRPDRRLPRPKTSTASSCPSPTR